MMETDRAADFDRLKEYLCDMILEEQIKLGFEKETIRFYSPCASVAHVLSLDVRSPEEVYRALHMFPDYVRDIFGDIKISRSSGDRICFLIPAQGACYVHENRRENPFLEELIGCFSHHGITAEDVRNLFLRWSEGARCIHIGSTEFDDVFFFDDGVPDHYRYCVKFDEGHAFYHRFLREDFEELFGASAVGKEHEEQ